MSVGITYSIKIACRIKNTSENQMHFEHINLIDCIGGISFNPVWRKTFSTNNCLLLKGNSFASLHASSTKPEVLASFAPSGDADTQAHENTVEIIKSFTTQNHVGKRK
jgi:hypothetical protein